MDIKIIFAILFFNQINYLNSQQSENINKTVIIENSIFNGIYRIDSKYNNYPLKISDQKVKFHNKKEGKEENFRIIPIVNNLYFIESKPFNKRLGIDDKGEIILLEKQDSNIKQETYWNITRLSEDKYLIQNNYTKNYLEYIEDNNNNSYPICSKNLYDITKNDSKTMENIADTFIFSFFKLCEEVHIKPEHIQLIENEPIDVLIKYKDLSNKNLSRDNIKQVKKDEDHEELKYSVRSILENIPWVRKIVIFMPNAGVKYFKPINEISDKFVYIKDKDFLGFDTSNSHVFQYNLYKLSKFGISDNFILMDENYFFGKPINKTQFFYYDEEQKKVLPSVVTDGLSELIKKDVEFERNNLLSNRQLFDMHSFFGWKLSQLNAFNFLLRQSDSSLVNAGFTNNAIPLNLNDLKDIFYLIKTKYVYANEMLYSNESTIYDLQSQSLFNTYLLNIKKRKINSIPWIHIDLGQAEANSLNIEMFSFNTSGDREYTPDEYNHAINVLESKFNKTTLYEIFLDNEKKNISNNIYYTSVNNTEINKSTSKVYEKGNNVNENNNTSNGSNYNLSKRDNKLNEEKQKFNEDYIKLIEENKKLKESYNKLNEEKQKSNDDYIKLIEENKKLKESCNKFNEEYLKLNESYNKLTEGNHKLNEDFKKINETFRMNILELDKLNEEYKKITESYNKLNEVNQNLNNNFQKMDETFRMNNFELNKKLEDLVYKLNEITQKKMNENRGEGDQKKREFILLVLFSIVLVIIFCVLIIVICCYICPKKENKYNQIKKNQDTSLEM